MISTSLRAHCVTLLQHTDVDGAMQRLLTHEGRLQPNSNDRVKLSVRLTSPWSRSLTQHLINKVSCTDMNNSAINIRIFHRTKSEYICTDTTGVNLKQTN